MVGTCPQIGQEPMPGRSVCRRNERRFPVNDGCRQTGQAPCDHESFGVFARITSHITPGSNKEMLIQSVGVSRYILGLFAGYRLLAWYHSARELRRGLDLEDWPKHPGGRQAKRPSEYLAEGGLERAGKIGRNGRWGFALRGTVKG